MLVSFSRYCLLAGCIVKKASTAYGPTMRCMQIQVHRTVNDPLLQDGMHVRWDLSHIERHVAAAVDELKPAMVCHPISTTAHFIEHPDPNDRPPVAI